MAAEDNADKPYDDSVEKTAEGFYNHLAAEVEGGKLYLAEIKGRIVADVEKIATEAEDLVHSAPAPAPTPAPAAEPEPEAVPES